MNRKEHEANLEAMKAALLGSMPVRNSLERRGLTEQVALLNVAQFAILFNFDLSCLLYDVSNSRGSWRSKLYTRVLALLLFECGEDMSALLGGRFRRLIAHDRRHAAKLNALHKELAAFRRRNTRSLKRIRNTVVAHRDPNADLQLRALRELRVDTVEEMGWKMTEWLTRVHTLLSDMMKPPDSLVDA